MRRRESSGEDQEDLTNEEDSHSQGNGVYFSDLSDYFDEDEHLLNFHPNTKELSLDEVPYDRDLKFINIASSSRPRDQKISNSHLRMVHKLATRHLQEDANRLQRAERSKPLRAEAAAMNVDHAWPGKEPPQRTRQIWMDPSTAAATADSRGGRNPNLKRPRGERRRERRQQRPPRDRERTREKPEKVQQEVAEISNPVLSRLGRHHGVGSEPVDVANGLVNIIHSVDDPLQPLVRLYEPPGAQITNSVPLIRMYYGEGDPDPKSQFIEDFDAFDAEFTEFGEIARDFTAHPPLGVYFSSPAVLGDQIFDDGHDYSQYFYAPGDEEEYGATAHQFPEEEMLSLNTGEAPSSYRYSDTSPPPLTSEQLLSASAGLRASAPEFRPSFLNLSAKEFVPSTAMRLR